MRAIDADALREQFPEPKDWGDPEQALMHITGIWAEIDNAPTIEPEIVRCKECKYWHREIYNNIEYFNYSSCDLNHGGDGHNFYCADAERRASNDESGSD